MSKRVHKQKLQLAKVFEEFYTAFKEKHPNVNIGSQSSVPRDPNGLFWLAQK